MINNKITKKLQNRSPLLLTGASLDEQNRYIKQILRKNSVNADIQFKPELLEEHINRERTFGKGLVAYLKQLEEELDNAIIDNKDLKSHIFQILSELGSLVFPSTTACYSLIPNDVKKLDWKTKIHEFNEEFKKTYDAEKIEKLLNIFLIFKHPQTVICLIALCLCKVLIRSMNQPKFMQESLRDDNLDYATQKIDTRPRVKCADWLIELTRDIKVHLVGLSVKELDADQYYLVKLYSEELAKTITEELLDKNLIKSYKTITTLQKTQQYKTTGYLVWVGSDLTVFPRALALPMTCLPNDWIINNTMGADSGGYLLSELTNISYQGYLDSKTFRLHEHRLNIKNIDPINCLQKVKFAINSNMVNFYKKYAKELTENEILLLDDTWIKPKGEMILKINNKWSKIFKILDEVSEACSKELTSNKNETLRNQEILRIAEMYCDKEIYWPAVQDFRGRIYRIGNLNIQLNEFVRSLITFSSDKAFVNRKKRPSTEKKYKTLLQEVLVKKEYIDKWDEVFGRRLCYKDEFEQLLFDDLLAKKLSLIQVGQLLLIRQGAYDKVGVYYDASASAYQIMGTINADKELCELTNVIATANGEKQNLKNNESTEDARKPSGGISAGV